MLILQSLQRINEGQRQKAKLIPSQDQVNGPLGLLSVTSWALVAPTTIWSWKYKIASYHMSLKDVRGCWVDG